MLVIASCSSTKRYPVPRHLDAATIHARSLEDYADKWLERVEVEPPAGSALEVYGGAGHAAVSQGAAATGAQLIFVSAGLGVIRSGERIPAYNLTVSKRGPGPFQQLSIAPRPSQWWASLHRTRARCSPLADFIRKHDDIVVLALPISYLALVQDDLSLLGQSQVAKLRVITTPGCRLPEALQSQAILYDNRLASLDEEYSGSMSSLVQRAARHLLCDVIPDRRLSGVASQRKRVQTVLGALKHQRVPERRKLSDAAITAVIRQMVATAPVPATGALRILRDKHGIACEQARFGSLYRKVTGGKS